MIFKRVSMSMIDRNSPVPLYFQLKQILLSKIEGGIWHAGDLIPGEMEISSDYGLSRTTVRQTLASLVEEGHIKRHRGRGTFVNSSPTNKAFRRNDSTLATFETISLEGKEPGWDLIKMETVDSFPKDIRNMLKLEEGDSSFTIERVRLANDQPVGWHQSWLPNALAQRINENLLLDGSSKSYLQHLPELLNAKAQRIISADIASEKDAQFLKIEVGSPILQIQRLVSNGTQPLEVMRARYAFDQFQYQLIGTL